MSGYRVSRRWPVVVVLAILVAVPLGVHLTYTAMGSIVVEDPENAVDSVELTGGYGGRRLVRLPGLFVGTAGPDGLAIVHCRNGRTINLGYMTSGMGLRERIAGPRGCNAPMRR